MGSVSATRAGSFRAAGRNSRLKPRVGPADFDVVMSEPEAGPPAGLARGQALHRAGRTREAEQALREAIAEAPEQPEAWMQLALLRHGLDDFAQAEALMRETLERRPDWALAHFNLGVVRRDAGNHEGAADAWRAALRRDRDFVLPYAALARERRFEEREPLLDEIEALLAEHRLPEPRASVLHFAAGKILDDLDETEAAFAHYERGNRLAGRRFDWDTHLRLLENSLQVYSRRFFARAGARGSTSETPVFVVGLPRTGSSLLEQMLASHPQVHGIGEIGTLSQIAQRIEQRTRRGFPLGLARLRNADFETLAREYLALVRERAGPDPTRIVDKHPLNFRFLGLVAEMFPRARILVTCRDPRDAGLSCYFQDFQEGQDYSFDLVDLARYFRCYERWIDHWRQVLPLPLLEVRYEELVRAPEVVLRRVLAFLDLPFDARCLGFHRSPRPVRTASSAQVREPLYERSIGRFRRYERQLAPFLRALEEGSP